MALSLRKLGLLLLLIVLTMVLLFMYHKSGSIYIKQALYNSSDSQQSLDFLDIETFGRKVLSHDPISFSPVQAKTTKGYVTAIKYSGQQGSGIKALRSQQCWASTLDMPMYILEPSMSGNGLRGSLPMITESDDLNFTTNLDQLTFSDLFDIDYYNKLARDSGLAQLSTREDFIQNAPRRMIIVRMDWIARQIPDEERHTEVLWPTETHDISNECFNIDSNKNLPIKSLQLKQIINKGYCIVKIVSTPHSPAREKIFSQKVARKTIYGQWSPNEVTVVFTIWREPWFVPVTSSDNKRPACTTPDPFQPSPRIVKEVKWYEEEYLGGKNTLAIMFRLERMFEFLYKTNVNAKMSVNKCLSEVIKLSQTIRRKQEHFRKPFITLDLGKSGSSSWGKTLSNLGGNMTDLTRKVKKTLSTLYRTEWTFEDWESSFRKATKGIENGGYIAALQRTLASRADCLILLGGGHFQTIALNDYLQKHPNKSERCIHMVCAIGTPVFNKIIDDYDGY